MATSESDIRKGVSVLLNQYGTLDTTEVKKLLETVLPFDEDDIEPSSSRSEPKIVQRIGNIVSHQTETIKVYYDTYQIDHKNENDLFIYRVYNFDMINKTGEIEIIKANKLFTDYKFDPISYKVTKKYGSS